MTLAPTCPAPVPATTPTDAHRTHVPALRLLPVPPRDPPHDDLPHDDVRDGAPAPTGRPSEPGVQGTLALAFTLPSGVPAEPEPSPALRVVADGGDEEDPFRPRLTPRVALPDPRLWAARFVQALVEVVAGERPNTQLVRWTSTEVHDQLDERVRLVAAAGAPGVRRAPRWLVRSVHVSEPVDGVAEVCGLVTRAGRHAALALRLEGIDGRWRCTALELGW